MERIGFFGGCFNPPTIAHFEIVKNSLDKFDLDKVVVIPMGDKYPKKDLIEFKHRFNMLENMFEDEEKVEISNMQENQKNICYAIDSFNIIDEQYKNCERFFIMGFDNFVKMETWKNSKEIISNRKFIVFDRKNYNDLTKKIDRDNINFVNVNNSTSSSLVREKIKAKNNIKEFMVPNVVNYITKEGLYK